MGWGGCFGLVLGWQEGFWELPQVRPRGASAYRSREEGLPAAERTRFGPGMLSGGLLSVRAPLRVCVLTVIRF